jgi:hypothetical protein
MQYFLYVENAVADDTLVIANAVADDAFVFFLQKYGLSKYIYFFLLKNTVADIAFSPSSNK